MWCQKKKKMMTKIYFIKKNDLYFSYFTLLASYIFKFPSIYQLQWVLHCNVLLKITIISYYLKQSYKIKSKTFINNKK